MEIVARVSDENPGRALGRSTEGNGVKLISLGDWSGAVGIAKSYPAIRAKVQTQLANEGAVICVAPGVAGSIATRSLRKYGSRPYGVEVIGDPHDVYAPGSVKHPIRPLLRNFATMRLREQCKHAAGVAYVNRRGLPNRYPPNEDAYVTHYSSIDLQPEHFRHNIGFNTLLSEPVRIITVGSMEQVYKGIDVLLDAVTELKTSNRNITVTIVGDGKHRAELEQQAKSAGIDNEVRFVGHVAAGETVRNLLDEASLFVLASRTEGLPRSMIEAMARGLPCIGTAVGGIPELLPSQDLVPPNDPHSLATKILEVAQNPDRMLSMSVYSIEKANEYSSEVLQERRLALYTHVRDATKSWWEARK